MGGLSAGINPMESLFDSWRNFSRTLWSLRRIIGSNTKCVPHPTSFEDRNCLKADILTHMHTDTHTYTHTHTHYGRRLRGLGDGPLNFRWGTAHVSAPNISRNSVSESTKVGT